MKKHLSVFALMVRHNLIKALLLFIVSIAAQSVMFYLTLKNAITAYEAGLGMETFEVVIERSKLNMIFAVQFLLLALILCTTCRSSSTKAIYTLRRLSVSNRSIILWQSLSGVFYLFMMLAFEIFLVLIFSKVYINLAPKEMISSQTVFLAFYKNNFLHALLPLESTSTYIRNLVFIIGVSVCSAVFSAYSLIGKFSFEILGLCPLVLLSFQAKLGEPTVDFLVGFYAVCILGWCIFDIFKKEGGINEEV